MKLSFVAALLLVWAVWAPPCECFRMSSHSISHRLVPDGDDARAKFKQVELRFAAQKLDHVTPEDHRIFSQRYFENLDFFTNSNGPILLVVCGEWDCEGSYGAFVPELAKLLGAAVVTLEHRYYGKSSPFQELTVENLKYLTSDQAIHDLAIFRGFYQDSINSKYRQHGENRWFVIGSSYPGALSAWFRLKFPDLVRGSLASSAVVQAIMNFTAMDEQVAVSIGPECASALREATSLAEERLATNATAVKSLFQANALLDDDFLSFLGDVPAIQTQGARQSVFCSPLVQAKRENKDLLSAYAGFMKDNYDARGWNRQFIKEQVQAGGPHTAERNWLYQVCTQFGFFPVTNTIHSLRLTSKYYLDLCDFVFGNGTHPNVDAVNRNYGGWNISGSRILFTNGLQDPWRHASKQISSPGEPSFVAACDTCAHGVGLNGCSTPEGYVSSKCKEQLEKARTLITSYAKEWLFH